MPMPPSVNTFHQDRWKINFSNIPSVTNYDQMPMYDLFVKSLVIPDYNIDIVDSMYLNNVQHHPISKKNEGLSQLQITFKVSENLENYYNLFYWMMTVKYGEVDTTLIKKSIIDAIAISVLDNQKREKVILTFKKCILVSLSSLSLTMGVSEEADFTCNFTYETVHIEQQ